MKITLHGLIIDKKMLSLIARIGNERLDDLTTADFLAINELYFERRLSTSLKVRLKHLSDMGIVEHIGRNKYILARSLYSAAGKTGVHTRIVGLDRETNKELLVKHIENSGEKGTPFKELQQVLPGLNRSQIQVLLRELRLESRVYTRGKTSAARWFYGPEPGDEQV